MSDTDLSNTGQASANKSSYLSFITEGVIIVVLTLVILFTLNYFSLVPFSKIFPWLSFLPQAKGQAQMTVPKNVTNSLNSRTIQYIVTPQSPLTLNNDTSEYMLRPIENSNIAIVGDTEVTVELGFQPELNAPEDASDSSGFIFDNGLSGNNLRKLFLFYYPKGIWGLQYTYGSKQKILPLYNVIGGQAYGQFNLSISGNGTNVKITLPNGEKRSLELPVNIYGPASSMTSRMLVASHWNAYLPLLNYKYNIIGTQ